MKGYLLFILWSVLICMNLQGGTFVMQDEETSTISLDTVIHENTVMEPFPSEISISSLVFSGEITLHSKSSLVRIILVDIHHHEYLIHETYPLLAGSSKVSLDKVGEETTILNNIIPSSIKVDLIDASVHLREVIFSEEDASQKQLAPDVLKSQSQSKIDMINKHIREAGLKWIAGETSISKMTYQEKKRMFGGSIPNLQGFEYYIGGVFVLPGTTVEDLASMNLKSANSVHADTQFVSEYSWRNRHGQDWTTTVKDQGGCNSCWAFASAAATELLVNLYYNQHLDYDLSEQNLISCITGSCSQGGTYIDALNYIRDTGVVLEDCFPYSASELPCTDVCSNPSERIQIANNTVYHSVEDKKKAIIRGAAGLNITDWSHLMQVVGFKTITEGDSLFVRNSGDPLWITFEENHPLIGSTAWLCKNSYGTEWGDSGYIYIIGENNDLPLYYLNPPVSSMLLDTSDILCVDKDGDGFYSWGVGPKTSHCTECPDQPDGDDSDPCIGPMNEYGYLSQKSPRPMAKDTSVIYCNVIPDLYAAGTNIQWYSDKQLLNHVHSGDSFPTGHTEPGQYTYYATQTSLQYCESEATEVILSITLPYPRGQDTLISDLETGILSVTGESNAVFKWYADPSLDTLLGHGETYNTGLSSFGTYTFYVTQTICSLESEPDTVVLTIWRHNQIIFPDVVFENALIKQGVDTSNDSWISYSEAKATLFLDVSGEGISDLTGIENFVNLDTLICSDNQLTVLDVSNNIALLQLDCGANEFTTLDISKNTSLTHLNCSGNKITWLELSNNTALTYLDCSYNELISLDVSENIELSYLDCRNNQFYLTALQSLDVSNNTTLAYLDCSNNDLTSLDVSNNPELTYLDCSMNGLTRLELLDNTSLTSLIITDMPVLHVVCVWTTPFPPDNVEIDTSGSPYVFFTPVCADPIVFIPDKKFLHALIDQGVDTDADSLISYAEAEALNTMEVSFGGILDMTGIEAFVNLDILNCDDNQLTLLNVANSTALSSLSCKGNHLTSLNLSSNTSLRHLDCSGNQFNWVDISQNDSLTSLLIKDMPTLYEVCVWTTPFPPDEIEIDTSGSPHAFFTTECDNLKVNIPDNKFLKALIDEGVDTNGDGLISFREAAAVLKMEVPSNEISDMTGIEAFTNLDTLLCANNQITTLDVSNNTALTSLNCEVNQLTHLDVSKNTALTSLNCEINQLSNLDVSNIPGLTSLNCGYNPLTNLDVSYNVALTHLMCPCIPITSLDLTNNLELEVLIVGAYFGGYYYELDYGVDYWWYCDRYSPRLTSLDVSQNTALEELYCAGIQLADLDVTKNAALKKLGCPENQLTSLDVSLITALTWLDCENNQLSSLDVSKNLELWFLRCEDNQLTNLDVSKNLALSHLDCGGNQLTSLNLCNNDSIRYLWIGDMPTLDTVSVWETPFPPLGVYVYPRGNPNVVFSDCAATGLVKYIKNKSDFKIYPNPANDLLMIETSRPGQHSIEITSLNGKLLYTNRMEGPVHQIDLSSFEKGLYFITISSRDYVRSEKIIKQ